MAGRAVPRGLGEAASPDRAAVVVYDMQVGILNQLADGRATLARVLELLDWARSLRHAVFFLRHRSLPTRLMGTFQRRQAMHWQRLDDPEAIQPWFLPGTDGFALAAELAPRDDEAVFDKLGMSAFEGTPLGFAIRDLGLDAFIIAGIATEIGIEPSVRHGADLGLIPIVVRDGCGHGHGEAGEKAMENIDHMGDAFTPSLAELKAAVPV